MLCSHESIPLSFQARESSIVSRGWGYAHLPICQGMIRPSTLWLSHQRSRKGLGSEYCSKQSVVGQSAPWKSGGVLPNA